MHRITLSIELPENSDAVDGEVVADALRDFVHEWEANVYEFHDWKVRDSKVTYVQDLWIPHRSPNGIWWALRGRLRFARNGWRVHFSMSRGIGSRGVFFAVPPRIKRR